MATNDRPLGSAISAFVDRAIGAIVCPIGCANRVDVLLQWIGEITNVLTRWDMGFYEIAGRVGVHLRCGIVAN